MPFPETDRVVYNLSPLDNVVCQLRYSPILIIDSNPPAEFQELIRKDFPSFEEDIEIQQDIPAEYNMHIPNQFFNSMSNITKNKNYSFISEDGHWRVNLTRTFIALTTTNYERWEHFYTKLEAVVSAFNEIYKPSFFTRIGLRYIDVFKRSVLNLDSTDWKDLINSPFIGILSSGVSNSVYEYNSSFEIDLADKISKARIINMLVTDIEKQERCFFLDSDFYTQSKIGISDLHTKLDYLHSRSSRLLRYVIKDKLHKAMEPRII